MANLEATSPATAEQEAAVLINNSVQGQIEKGKTDGDELARVIQKNTEHVTGETRAKIDEYIPAMLEATKDGNVDKLEQGVGGQVDVNKQKTIAATTLTVHRNIEDTLGQMKETGDHEDYHKKNGHTEAIASAPDKEGDVAVTVGGEDFTNTEFIEGLTVDQTGDKYVSAEYRKHRQRFRSALSKSGMSVGEVEVAIDKRDLGLIDDNAKKPEYALAA